MTYDPENLYAYEVGFKSTIMGRLARLNGAAYYYDYQDYQAFYITGIDTITFNTDATSSGAELELQASPIDGMDLLLGAAYNDIKVDLPNGMMCLRWCRPNGSSTACCGMSGPCSAAMSRPRLTRSISIRSICAHRLRYRKKAGRLYCRQRVPFLHHAGQEVAGAGLRR